MSRGLAVRLGVWSALLQAARLGINALVFLVLARVLPLAEVGAFSVAFAIAQLAQSLVRAGVLETVIAAERHDDAYLSAAHAVVIACGAASSALLVLAGAILWWLNADARTGLFLLALAVLPLSDAWGVVPDAVMRRALRFRALAIRTTLALTAAGAAALAAGFAGFGAWALAAFSVAGSVLSSALALAMCGRRIPLRWGPEAREIAQPAARLALSALATASILPVSQVAVGAIAGHAAAGAYAIAQRLVGLLTAMTVEPARSVALPFLSRVTADEETRRRAVIQGLGLMITIMTPLYFGLYATAPVALPLLLGENGARSAPVVAALCWQYVPLAISVIVAQLLLAVRQPREVLVFTS
ncbi:MAG TPA: oligosaccharide flippase family protein, partial [Polyangiaceae bacterium]|nr:oligosaccharide flippase family protein [Polyangiaceae bacterium]